VTTYSERLTAPLSWWFSAAAFAAVWGWLVLVATNWPIATSVAAVVAAFSFAAVWRYGSLLITVNDDGLKVGRATLPRPHIGVTEALDRTHYRHRLGTGADARAHLVTRPYLDRGVLVTVDDHADPTPYWLLSSRRPEALAATLGQTEGAQGSAAHETIQEAPRGKEA